MQKELNNKKQKVITDMDKVANAVKLKYAGASQFFRAQITSLVDFFERAKKEATAATSLEKLAVVSTSEEYQAHKLQGTMLLRSLK